MQTASSVLPSAPVTVKAKDAYLIEHLTPKAISRFWAKVSKGDCPDSCWWWTASLDTGGYGQIKLGEKLFGAHRVAYVIANDHISRDDSYHGLCVCHKCDNRACCRPDHLFLGTHKQNMADRDAKCRGSIPLNCGERQGSSKLTEGNILEIRRMADNGYPRRYIAEKFSIVHQHVSDIVHRKRWAHI